MQSSTEESEGEYCPLPLLLQDLCLFVVVNDFNKYPVELLSSLPCWLRCRLIKALPALYLSGLESSPVAEGINVDELWNSVNGSNSASSSMQELTFRSISAKRCFQLNVGDAIGLHSFLCSPCNSSFSAGRRLENEVKTAFKDVEERETKIPAVKAYLLTVASDILSERTGYDLKALTHKVVSIRGDILLSNLLSGSSLHQPCQNSLCCQRVWMKQATALARNPPGTYMCGHDGYSCVSNVKLTPRSLLHLCDKRDPSELLSSLAQENLQPNSASVCVESISKLVLNTLQTEQLANVFGSHTLHDDVKYTSIMNCFLEKVIILRLQCDKYSNVGVMIGMINTATGQNSKLKYLFCTLPEIYMDVVLPFSRIFTLRKFKQLTLEVNGVYPLTLCKLLQGFMTASCPHKQRLVIFPNGGMQFPNPLKASQLATLNVTPSTIPPCSLQHKTLGFSCQEEFSNALYLILQFPTVRLKEIAIVNLSECRQYLHFCAIHPDLQTTRLVIDLRDVSSDHHFLATAETDLISLLKIPPVQEICISGNWGNCTEVKRGIAIAIQGRSKDHLPPLSKLFLEIETAQYFKRHDFQTLCDAIFTLAELENLNIVFGKGFVDMLQQHGYEDVMYTSWLYYSREVKLKSFTLQAHVQSKTKFDKLRLITHELSLPT